MLLPRDKLFTVVSQLRVVNPIRSVWGYLVCGYSIAGEIIEQLRGQSLDGYLKSAIFDLQGMKDTTTQPCFETQGNIAEPCAELSNGEPHYLEVR